MKTEELVPWMRACADFADSRSDPLIGDSAISECLREAMVCIQDLQDALDWVCGEGYQSGDVDYIIFGVDTTVWRDTAHGE